MLPKKSRLTRSRLKEALFGRGQRIQSDHFSAIVLSKTGGYTIVIPKKIARLSTTRHRLKRRVVGALQSLSPLPPSLILFPKASLQTLDHRHLVKELAALLSKIGNYRY